MTAGEPIPSAGSVLRRVLGAAGIYVLASVLAKAGAIVLIPLYTRRLTVEAYGDYALALTVMQILPSVLSLGLGTAVARFFFEGTDLEAARRRTGSIARAQIGLTVALAVVAQLTVLLVRPAGSAGLFGRWELSCMIWASAGSSLATIPTAYLRATQRPIATSLFQLSQFVCVTLSGIVLVAVLDRGLRGAIEAAALAYAINGVAAVLFVQVALPGRFEGRLLREGLRFGLPFVPHYASTQLHLVFDRWTMKAEGLQAELGGYSLASQLVTPTSMVMMAWHEAISPAYGEIYRKGGLPALAAQRWPWLRGYVLAAALPAALTLLALPVLGLIIGGDYRQALWVMPYLLASILVETLYYPSFDVLFYAQRTAVLPFVTGTSTLISIVLNLVLVPRYGVPGALGARLISMSARSGIIWLAAQRALRAGAGPAGSTETPPPSQPAV